MTKMKLGTCRLCLQERPLAVMSHLFPNWMYADLLQGGERIFQASVVQGKPQQTSKPQQTGVWQAHILCLDCENTLLGELDRYAARFFRGEGKDVERVAILGNGGPTVIVCRGGENEKVRLFGLSLLWRASISDHPFFEHFSLGEFEERVRRRLQKGDVSEGDFLPTLLIECRDQSLPRSVVRAPYAIQNGEVQSFVLFIAGYCFLSFSAGGKLPAPIRQHFLTLRGEISIIRGGPSCDGFLRELMSQQGG